ncbi:MAG TPA: hypothetical protein VNZ58_04235 [Thermomicrobiales bacterium]|nr:hypothetical protein [Thermomicrobiales bacterium]
MTKSTNPDAVRGPSGIWNENILPVVEWEAAEHRVVLPSDLQHALGIATPVLRWDRSKREAVLREHLHDAAVIHAINDHLLTWTEAGSERDKPENHRILFTVERRFYAVSIGKRRDGSDSIIIVFGSSSRSFRSNRLRGMVNVVERGK